MTFDNECDFMQWSADLEYAINAHFVLKGDGVVNDTSQYRSHVCNRRGCKNE